ncbi:MAG: transcriptional repressor [Actinomycetota bacterium]
MSMLTDDLDAIHSQAAELLRDGGHRYTAARRRIVAALIGAEGPITIPQLLTIADHLVQSSTYRNLSVLEEAGVVARVITREDHARYELDERLTRHHHHLICTDCGEVLDFELSPSLEASLDQELQRAGQAVMFRIEHHRLDLLGTCMGCS